MTKYKEILKKFELVHIYDDILHSTFYELMNFCTANQFIIGSVSSLSKNGDLFLEICPNNLKFIVLEIYNFTESDILKRFANLKMLRIEIANVGIFRCCLANIEILMIWKKHTANGLDNRATPILSKLKNLVVEIQYANEFPNVNKIFRTLELFHLHDSKITDLMTCVYPLILKH